MSSVLGQLAAAVAAVCGLLAFIRIIHGVGRRQGWRPEVQRKCVHVATGLFAMAFPFLFQDRWPMVLLVAVAAAVMAVLRLPAIAERGMGAALHSVGRKSYGDILLALAIGFVFLRSRDNLILYTLPVAVITLSDSAAALAGSTYGRRLFEVEAGTKSVEGVTMFFLVTWIVTMAMLLLFTDVSRANVVVLGVMVAAFGALVEAYSWRGFDNLFVPVAIHFFLERHLASPPLELGLLALSFLAATTILVAFAPLLRITAHTARAYVVAVFLICGISGLAAAVFPVATILAHLAARARHPCRSPYPDLDLLAMMAGVALVWLIVGESLGPSAVNLFALTFAGTVLIYVAITADRNPLVVLAAGAAVLAVHAATVALSDPEKQWHGDLVPYTIASLALCALVATLRPGWFDRWRAPRAAGVAVVVPFATYLGKVLL